MPNVSHYDANFLMLKKCHYYAQIAIILCSIIINIKINKTLEYITVDRFMCIRSENGNSAGDSDEEAADNVVELELLEAMHVFVNLQLALVLKVGMYLGRCLVWESYGFSKVFIKHKESKKLCTIISA